MAGLQQAKLIQTRARVAQLEGEVAGLQRAAKRARIEEELQTSLSASESLPRLHQLERERCELLEELTTTKEQLHSTGAELNLLTTSSDLTSSCDKENKELKTQLSELRLRVESLEGEKVHLHTQLSLAEQQTRLEREASKELEQTHGRRVESLQCRVRELEDMESQLLQSQAKVKTLERQLRRQEQDLHFSRVMGGRAQRYEERDREVEQLSAENAALKQHRDNVELLRYKLQVSQEQCDRHTELLSEAAALRLETQRLQERLQAVSGEEGGVSQPALQLRLSELQQSEVVLLCRAGELETKVRLLENTVAMARSEVAELKQKLAKEQSEGAVREQRVQRLERKLLFVTKERDGCVNVLQSYKQDSGVEGLLQEQLAEMQQQLVREKERVAELEAELDTALRKTVCT